MKDYILILICLVTYEIPCVVNFMSPKQNTGTAQLSPLQLCRLIISQFPISYW